MKVTLYTREDECFDVLVQAELGRGRPPLLLQRVPRDKLTEMVEPAIVAAKRPREPRVPKA